MKILSPDKILGMTIILFFLSWVWAIYYGMTQQTAPIDFPDSIHLEYIPPNE